MSLDEALSGLASQRGAPRPGVGCGVSGLSKVLPEQTWLALVDLIENPRSDGRFIAASQICVALRENGHNVGQDSIRRHRRRALGTGCSCPLI